MTTTRLDSGGPRLTVVEHLEELRRRLGISLAAFLLATAIGLTQARHLIAWLKRPADAFLPQFAFFTPTEPLVAYVKVSVLAGLMLAMPVLLAQGWGFVRSGLLPKERATGAALIGWGTFQFVAGVMVAYLWLVPAALRILLGIGAQAFEPVISIDRYLSFMTTLLFWSGLVFELPVVLVILAKADIVTSAWLRQQRAYAALVLVIIAALITPTTDPVNLLLLAGPLLLLYEASIWLTRFTTGGKPSHGRRAERG